MGIVQAVMKAEDLQTLRDQLLHITVREELMGYAVDLIRATRTHESVLVGAGPRAPHNPCSSRPAPTPRWRCATS